MPYICTSAFVLIGDINSMHQVLATSLLGVESPDTYRENTWMMEVICTDTHDTYHAAMVHGTMPIIQDLRNPGTSWNFAPRLSEIYMNAGRHTSVNTIGDTIRLI